MRFMPLPVYALTAGAFGIGVTEFVIMGLLLEVAADLGTSVHATGLLISGYALGVVVAAPLLTAATRRWPRRMVLVGLMLMFTAGNVACAVAPNYGLLLAARVLTAFAHGPFFGVGSMVATKLVPQEKRASAVAIMFTGLTVATVLGVPFGTWLGQALGWRATFWAVAAIGIAATAVMALCLPATPAPRSGRLRAELVALGRRPVLLAFATTALGYAGVFTVFTYIAPLLTRISGFDNAAVPPILLVFGAGLIVGNLLGGRLADRHLSGTLTGSLVVLAAVLGLMTWAMQYQLSAVIFVGLLGAAAFATVPPLQLWVMEQTRDGAQTLASSCNIAAFNLGNALGAWVGGLIISRGPGLEAITWIAALAPLCALGAMLAGRHPPRNPSPVTSLADTSR